MAAGGRHETNARLAHLSAGSPPVDIPKPGALLSPANGVVHGANAPVSQVCRGSRRLHSPTLRRMLCASAIGGNMHVVRTGIVITQKATTGRLSALNDMHCYDRRFLVKRWRTRCFLVNNTWVNKTRISPLNHRLVSPIPSMACDGLNTLITPCHSNGTGCFIHLYSKHLYSGFASPASRWW